MPKYCNQLPDRVDLVFDDGSVVTYSTRDRFNGSSYCYKPPSGERPHFTVVDTGGGRRPFQRFHITDDWGSGGDIRVFYHETAFENYAPLGSRVSRDLQETWDRIAEKFWDAMNQ